MDENMPENETRVNIRKLDGTIQAIWVVNENKHETRIPIQKPENRENPVYYALGRLAKTILNSNAQGVYFHTDGKSSEKLTPEELKNLNYEYNSSLAPF